MPQLNLAYFPSEILWLFSSFSLLYIASTYFIIPRFNAILRKRAHLIANNIQFAKDVTNQAKEIQERINQLEHTLRLQIDRINQETKEKIAKMHHEQIAECNARIKSEHDHAIELLKREFKNINLEKEITSIAMFAIKAINLPAKNDNIANFIAQKSHNFTFNKYV